MASSSYFFILFQVLFSKLYPSCSTFVQLFSSATRFTYCLYRCQCLSDDSCLHGQTDISSSDASFCDVKVEKDKLSFCLLIDRYQERWMCRGKSMSKSSILMDNNDFVGCSVALSSYLMERLHNPVKPVQKILSSVVVMELTERTAGLHR